MKISPWLCLLLALCYGCSPQFQPGISNHDFVAFGTGGGFTGLETTYFLLPDGQLLKRMTTGGKIENYTRINRSTSTQIFNSIRSFNLISYQYDRPGNAYRFLDLHLQNVRNRIVWAEGDTEVRGECKELDALLNQLISEQ